jgi:hypothetical protein
MVSYRKAVGRKNGYQHCIEQKRGGRGVSRSFVRYSAVVPGGPLSLVTVAKFNISARGKSSTGRTQQQMPTPSPMPLR